MFNVTFVLFQIINLDFHHSPNLKLLFCQSILLAPDTELIQYSHQRFPTLRKCIFHLRRNLRILGTDDQSICFQFLEIRAEGLVGNGFQIPFQLIEPHGFKFHQAVKNDHLVFAGDQRQRVGKAGVLEIGVLNIVLYHLLSPKIVPVIIAST